MNSEAEYAVLISKGKVLIQACRGETPRLPRPDEVSLQTGPSMDGRFRFGHPIDAEAIAVDEGSVGETMPTQEWTELRASASIIPAEHYATAAKASELLFWDSTTRRCSVCGAEMVRHTEISKRCTGCGREIWPTLSPAVIVLVRRGKEALLVHAKTFSKPFYGLVAGFVETGESLEECVRREVKEETSLEIDNIRYFGSQSWPFPSQLMIGFTADYASGEVRFSDGELTSGGFFSRDSLPQIPRPPSIAREMIDAWLEGRIDSQTRPANNPQE